MVLVFVSGIVFYCVYSVVQLDELRHSVNEITSVRLTSGNTPCECDEPVDSERLFYNRAPKCGSTTFVTLMRRLAKRHNYSHHHATVYNRRSVGEDEQRNIVKRVTKLPTPCSFDQHVFFLNFTKFGASPPIFFNVIRDPVERLISSYYYRRMTSRRVKLKLNVSEEWLNKKLEHCVYTSDKECTFLEGRNYTILLVPYFCGQEPHCILLNDRAALQQAKHNIERYYPVVGTLEDINITLQVMEAVLPQWFDGIYKLYHNSGLQLNKNREKQQVKEEVKESLRANLTTDYELYRFVQQRLYYQYNWIKSEDKKVEKQEISLDKGEMMPALESVDWEFDLDN